VHHLAIQLDLGQHMFNCSVYQASLFSCLSMKQYICMFGNDKLLKRWFLSLIAVKSNG